MRISCTSRFLFASLAMLLFVIFIPIQKANATSTVVINSDFNDYSTGSQLAGYKGWSGATNVTLGTVAEGNNTPYVSSANSTLTFYPKMSSCVSTINLRFKTLNSGVSGSNQIQIASNTGNIAWPFIYQNSISLAGKSYGGLKPGTWYYLSVVVNLYTNQIKWYVGNDLNSLNLVMEGVSFDTANSTEITGIRLKNATIDDLVMSYDGDTPAIGNSDNQLSVTYGQSSGVVTLDMKVKSKTLNELDSFVKIKSSSGGDIAQIYVSKKYFAINDGSKYYYTNTDLVPDTWYYVRLHLSLNGKKIIALYGEDISNMQNWELVPNTYNFFDVSQTTISNIRSEGSEISNVSSSSAPVIQGHPRLMVTDFMAIKNKIQSDTTYTSKYYAKVKSAADNYYNSASNSAGFYAVNQVATLALACVVENDNKYLDRLWTYLNDAAIVSALDSDYNVMCAYAIAYDWLYSRWSSMQKSYILSKIKTNAFNTLKSDYTDNTNNIGQHNLSHIANVEAIMTALSINEDNIEDSETLILNATKSLYESLKIYPKSGEYPESHHYWSLSAAYLATGYSSMNTAMGTDFGLSQIPGFMESGMYDIYMHSPRKLSDFRYGDSPPDPRYVAGPQLFWLASKFNKPEYEWWERNIANSASETRFPNNVLDVLWNDPTMVANTPSLALDKKFADGQAQVVTMRGSWSDTNALFIGVKGGYGGAHHGQLDAGSFSLSAFGELWIKDLGWEADYSKPGLFGGYANTSPRWTYYRYIGEAHNTMVVNPGRVPDQDASYQANIERFSSTQNDAFAVVDMTDIYKKSVKDTNGKYTVNVDSAKRGIRMLNRNQVIVQDEVKASRPFDIYSFLNFDYVNANSIVIDADMKGASIIKNGKKLWLHILAPSSATFALVDPKTISTTSSVALNTYNYVNVGTKKLSIALTDVSDTTISVLLMPFASTADTVPLASELPTVEPIATWATRTYVINQSYEGYTAGTYTSSQADWSATTTDPLAIIDGVEANDLQNKTKYIKATTGVSNNICYITPNLTTKNSGESLVVDFRVKIGTGQFQIKSSTSGYAIWLGFTNTRISFFSRSISTPTLTDNAWYYVRLVFDLNTKKIDAYYGNTLDSLTQWANQADFYDATADNIITQLRMKSQMKMDDLKIYYAGSAPIATNVAISGIPWKGNILVGSYTYDDDDGDLENDSTVQWLKSFDGVNYSSTGVTTPNYPLTNNDAGAYLKFQVTPRNKGCFDIGIPYMSDGLKINAFSDYRFLDFKVGDQVITSLEDGGFLKGVAKLVNYDNNNNRFMLVMAQYKGNELINTTISNATQINSGLSSVLETPTVEIIHNSDTTFKLFVWGDFGSISPMLKIIKTIE